MEQIRQSVDEGKEAGLTDQQVKAAVREGLNRHERRRNAAMRRKENNHPVSRVPKPESRPEAQ